PQYVQYKYHKVSNTHVTRGLSTMVSINFSHLLVGETLATQPVSLLPGTFLFRRILLDTPDHGLSGPLLLLRPALQGPLLLEGEALEDAVGVLGGPHIKPPSIRRELTGRQIPVQLPQHLRLPLMDGPSLGHPGQQRPGAEEHQPGHIFSKG
ncbi:MAG: hypothetical protein ACK53Y_11595, partial [bacterium]